MIVQAAPAEHFGWLSAQSRYAIPTDFRAIEAIDSSGKVRGMAGFGHWTPNSARALFAVDSPFVCRPLLGPAFSYPFEQVGVGVLLTFIASHAERGVRLAKHLGFREAHRIRDGFAPNDDLILFEMTKTECRWIGRSSKE